MRKAIIDASSAILLFKAHLFSRLVTIYEIVMAQSVYDELTIDGYPGARAFRSDCETNKFAVLQWDGDGFFRGNPIPGILPPGRGEGDTIRWFLNGAADCIIIDDGAGASYCKNNKIPYVNALLCARLLYLQRHISESDYHDAMRDLQHIGRYSRRIVEHALCCPQEGLVFFLASDL
ncbi:MAG: hypothetical protein JXD19_03580 [Deltaproteobacteria bacterium]|nr:hypothetical protein [Deltaproteobacteria bacterium]